MPTLTWVGKDKVVNHHHEVPFRVLNKQYSFSQPSSHKDHQKDQLQLYSSPKSSSNSQANSVNNRIIHGDNLEALKSLLPEFEGKVDCIYIDPPYNTGNEAWVYNDAVNDPKIKKWLGQVVGKEGEDLSRHDKWLCMMYPRLKLLQRLLSSNGFFFVSIDAFEFGHLKVLLDEIFGVQNFRNCIAVRRGVKNVQSQFDELQALSLGHEYIFLYSKNTSSKLPKLTKAHDEVKAGKWDTFWRGTDRPTMRYEIFGVNPPSGQWRWENGRTSRAINNYLDFKANHAQHISIDDFFLDRLQATNEKLDFVRLSENGVVQYYVPPQGSKLANDQWMDITLSGAFTDFDTEKNVEVLDRIVGWITGENPNAIILDSFAGSGTTAHAVLNLNAKDGGNRRFILVETMDYAETMTAQRVRRVMTGYGEGSKSVPGLGGSFDFYTIGEPIFLDDDNFNESIGISVIRDYVAFTEGILESDRVGQDNPYSPHLLGLNSEIAWLFNYELDKVTVLDLHYLAGIRFGLKKPQFSIIYADRCLLDEAFMTKHGISFKKIPRDITRF
ncbi:site-specific DNA-methyltransferase [Undibacterium sp. KW1]|uniref:site-specific DNA-methyltransferase n=1 Tax=Undibacterium sp. KW1 TaxID=2058624 RepID=UPI001331CB6B|nr:site-specific DNA-methyltransferase [Undibacterium sp. KW1]BBB60258.1 site-specific DNA-methyltransferase [Undibacterium sp. KW1]